MPSKGRQICRPLSCAEMSATNWGGNYAYRARQIRAPSSVEELQEIVSSSRRVRVLGARHSFTAIADAAELVTLDGIRPHIVIDSDAMTVSFGGALRYGELATELERHGLALSNLGSLPHLAVAGAISTATHGSGERNGNLATAVAAEIRWLDSIHCPYALHCVGSCQPQGLPTLAPAGKNAESVARTEAS